jgi:teichuronic acid biosynthesis glycosyltransferase TuaG
VNKGLPSTRNTAIEHSHSEFVALLDHDDYWTADHLENAMNCFASSPADIVHSGSILFDSKSGKEISIRAPSLHQTSNVIATIYDHSYIIQPSSAVLKKEIFKKVGLFDPNFVYCEDMEFWFRALRHNATIRYTGKESCMYRRHPDALSRSAPQMCESVARLYEKNLDWESIPRNIRLETTAEAFVSAGRMYLRSEPRRALKNFKRAAELQPHNLRILGYLAISKLLGLRNDFSSTNAI